MSDDAAAPARRPALSPSRASDFKQCPLLYRFRAIDRLPEPSSHRAGARLGRARRAGAAVRAARGQPGARHRDDAGRPGVGADGRRRSPSSPTTSTRRCGPSCSTRRARCCRATTGWRIRRGSIPQSCEQRVEVELSDGTLLRGFVDRIDVAPTGEMRVVDYKTGKAPPAARELAEAKAMFQMKFYAVALLRSRGVLPARLRLLYLADGQVLDYTPDLDELVRFEKTLMAMWRAIQSAGATGDFRPKPVADVRLVRPPRALPRRSAARRRPIPGWPGSRDVRRSPLRDRLPTTVGWPPTATSRCSSRPTGTREQLGHRDPARVTAAGAA